MRSYLAQTFAEIRLDWKERHASQDDDMSLIVFLASLPHLSRLSLHGDIPQYARQFGFLEQWLQLLQDRGMLGSEEPLQSLQSLDIKNKYAHKALNDANLGWMLTLLALKLFRAYNIRGGSAPDPAHLTLASTSPRPSAVEEVSLKRSVISPARLADFILPLYNLRSLRYEPMAGFTRPRLVDTLTEYVAKLEAFAGDWLLDRGLQIEGRPGNCHGVILIRKRDI